ncbi:MAG TPA: phenylalanine--tRNA ligase subunit alpha [Candidatus Portnoybacteria bacterium]|nr:phenylalanine--tRNA ligase subunit alpha [Candidatus Portnoybacteria bacterium]
MNMKIEIEKIKNEFYQEIKSIDNQSAIEGVRVKYLGRKGKINLLIKELVNVSSEEKRALGPKLNSFKKEIERVIKNYQEKILKQVVQEKNDQKINFTLPGKKVEIGHLHPITRLHFQVEDIFRSMGFLVLDGPEIESDYYNFTALNIPEWHPAREMHDTFYLENYQDKERDYQLLLRTHTSAMQVRAMEKYGAPLAVLVPGRVFRYEATDARHENTFYQIEGFLIDENITVANLVGTLKLALSKIFERDIKIRLRPGYFPFTEPSFEVDMFCYLCGGKGCPVCENKGWLEILGCGMIHPNVLRAGGINPDKYTGFAFGLGSSRLAQLKYGVNDARLALSGDLRFLKQEIL